MSQITVEHLRAEMLTWDNALRASDSGDLRGSLRLFEGIASTSKILVNMALLHDRLGEREEAIDAFTNAIDMDGYLAIAFFQRGVSYFNGEKYAEALKDFSKARQMMRTNVEINYDVLGLDYRLTLIHILFNQWLTLSKLGDTKGRDAVLQEIIEAKPSPELQTQIDDAKASSPCSLPEGTLYRPSAAKLQLLNAAQGMPEAATHRTSTPTSLRSTSSPASSTFLPSVSSRKDSRKHRLSISSTYKSSPLSGSSPDTSPVVHVPKRIELNRVIGPDMVQPMTDIHGIPCAGVRITHGPMAGLMAWRFFVQLEPSSPKSKLPPSTRPGVITNFILDTGNQSSYVPAETLDALEYSGDRSPGAEVTLRIQGVKTKCVVAHPGEVGRVGLSFTTAGSLTYYFDASIVAPVLYDGSGERPANVPRTIRAEDLPRRSWLALLRARILSMIAFSNA